MNSSRIGMLAGASLIALAAVGGSALAADVTPAPAAAPAAPASAAMTMPAMAFPLVANPHPTSFDLGPLGPVYVTGAVSGLGILQNNVFPGDRGAQVDLSNGQVFIQNTTGPIQFFIQAGAYSLPSLGSPYIRAANAIGDYFGPVPQGYVKFVPNSSFSIEAGKLPTLIGAEYTFTFENANIERGLLWNQEPAVSRGVQANYTVGPVAFALSLNDGYYSNRYNWLSGSATYTINTSNTLEFAAAGNLGTTNVSTLATPLAQNNSSIYNLIYTYTSGPVTIQPYLQYNHVPANTTLGIMHDASTYGAAVLANYAFTPSFSLAGRVEYIDSTGTALNGAPSLLYGAGSRAVSFTVTPTYQYKIYFARAEFSYVKAYATTPGLAFGPNGTDTSQARALLETGILF